LHPDCNCPDEDICVLLDKQVITYNDDDVFTIFIFNVNYMLEHGLIEIGDPTQLPAKELLEQHLYIKKLEFNLKLVNSV